MIENTSDRDPILHILGAMDGDWVPVEDLVAEPPPDPPGPVSPSASPSGTIGPAGEVRIVAGNSGFEFVQLMDLLVATAKAATERATAIAEEQEGRRRE